MSRAVASLLVPRSFTLSLTNVHGHLSKSTLVVGVYDLYLIFYQAAWTFLFEGVTQTAVTLSRNERKN